MPLKINDLEGTVTELICQIDWYVQNSGYEYFKTSSNAAFVISLGYKLIHWHLIP